jgi:hypothetical protein
VPRTKLALLRGSCFVPAEIPYRRGRETSANRLRGQQALLKVVGAGLREQGARNYPWYRRCR